jgi:hypothetical protein
MFAHDFELRRSLATDGALPRQDDGVPPRATLQSAT